MKNFSLYSPVVLSAFILIISLFPLSEAFPKTTPKIDSQIRLRKSERQRLTNEQKETLAQINIAEKRTTRVLEALKVLGENIERSQKKLTRLKRSMFLLKKQIIETGINIKNLEIDIEKDKEKINQQLMALFYVGRVKKMTLFLGLSSFKHYFRNQKLLQTSTQIDVALLDRFNQKLVLHKTEQNNLNIQRTNLEVLQGEEKTLKKLLDFERQQQVTYLNHLRTDRATRIQYLREIQVEMEQLNDKLYTLTVKKANQKKANLFKGFYNQKNSLQSPVNGKLIHRFGQRQSEYFTLFRRGVLVETVADESVSSILTGKVVWAGPFRGYQNLVILDHGKGSFSVYGNLGELFVLKDDVIDQDYILGSVAYDKVEERSLFYFEMRYNKKAVNPSHWLKKPRWKK